MYCVNCGKKIDDDNQFCPYCGEKLDFGENDETELPEDNEEYPEEEAEEVEEYEEDEEIVEDEEDEEYEEYEEDEAPEFSAKKSKIIIIVLACIIALCLAGIGVLLFQSNQDKDHVISADQVSVLDYDADWDSSYYDEKYGSYKVDVIMLVKNDSAEDISGLQFTMTNKNGGALTNALNSEEPFRAEGLVKSGQRGIMVGTVWTNEKKNTGGLSVAGAYKYEGEEDYSVPEGTISGAAGINNDYYSVRIDNPNNVEIGTTATFVCVVIDNDKLKDSDATGRIETPVAANSTGNNIKDVFQDPTLMQKFKEYTVYAIDSANYK